MKESLAGSMRIIKKKVRDIERIVERIVQKKREEIKKRGVEERRLYTKNLDHCKKFSSYSGSPKKRSLDFEEYLKSQSTTAKTNERLLGHPTEDVALRLFILGRTRIARDKNGLYYLFEKRTPH